MKSANPQFGLVLTGGGALGAYQVGALQYLAEIDFAPHIIAGSSIGALNSAMLATYRPLSHAIQRLDELWAKLSEVRPLRFNALTGSRYAARFFAPVLAPGLDAFYELCLDFMSSWEILPDSGSLLDITPIEQHIRLLINPDELRKGTELWITAFPCVNFFGIELDTSIEMIRARMGGETHWLCVNDFPNDEDIWTLLLASSALPWIFPRRKAAGVTYMDGGLTDNVPLKPLAERGCKYVIVIHLQNGSLWDRDKFPDQTIIEIRPQQRMKKSDKPILGMVETLFDFSAERIMTLKERGYEDARSCMEPILETLKIVNSQNKGINSLINSTNSLLSSTQQLLDDEPLV